MPSNAIDWGQPLQVLGRGSFGVVCKVQYNDSEMAAKRLDLTGNERARLSVEEMLREFKAMARICHPNVVKLYGVTVDDPTYVCLLMELANHGTLRDMLQNRRDEVLNSPLQQLRLSHDLVSGLAYLHERQPRPMLHHDLKSANVLLFSKAGNALPTAKLGDFGLATGISRTTYGEQSVTRLGGGTVTYEAPEAFDAQYFTASDVYSLAIIYWELLTADLPWHDDHARPYTRAQIMMRVVIRGERPPLPTTDRNEACAALRSIVQQAWAQLPEQRPTATHLREELRIELQRESRRQGIEHFPSFTFRRGALALAAALSSANAPSIASRGACSEEDACSTPTPAATDTSIVSTIDVFISLQAGDVDEEAAQLQRLLEARRLSVYMSTMQLSSSAPTDTVYAALQSARLVVLMASEAYGQRGAIGYGTYEQFQFVMEEGKTMYLIKMCEQWRAPQMRFHLGGRVLYQLWMPHTEMPPDLVSNILSKLAGLQAPQQLAVTASEPSQVRRATCQDGASLRSSMLSQQSSQDGSSYPLTGEDDLFDVFISLRFGEAAQEGQQLKAALEACGRSVFVCNQLAGVNLMDTIHAALVGMLLIFLRVSAFHSPALRARRLKARLHPRDEDVWHAHNHRLFDI